MGWAEVEEFGVSCLENSRDPVPICLRPQSSPLENGRLWLGPDWSIGCEAVWESGLWIEGRGTMASPAWPLLWVPVL